MICDFAERDSFLLALTSVEGTFAHIYCEIYKILLLGTAW